LFGSSRTDADMVASTCSNELLPRHRAYV
jgi:hypothetical protein